MKRSLLILALLASPVGAEPLFAPAEHMLWMRVPVLPDVVRPAAARGVAGGSGTSLPVSDATSIVEGSSDTSKEIRFEVDGLSTATVRVITVPDSNTTLPIFGQVITFAGPTAARTVTLPDSNFTVAGIGTTNAFSGANSFVDGSLSILGSVDPTKIALFEVDGFTAGNTRVFTLPGTTGNDTIMTLAVAQTVSATKTFSATNTIWQDSVNIAMGTSSDAVISYRTANTPDTLSVGVSSDSSSVIFREQADSGNDSNNGPCLTAACTHPTVVIMSATGATAADYSAHSYAGVAGKSVKTLTETTATATVQITVAAEAGTSGTYMYTVYATDGSTPQVRSGRVIFSVTNDGGTETCVLGTPEETDNTPTGTLTATIACDTSPTNAVNITIDATSSLTQTTLEAYSQVYLTGPGQLLPQ